MEDNIEKILEKINLCPSEVIFVDDQKKNLVPAKEMGIKTIWVDNTCVDPFGDNADFNADYKIYDLVKMNKIVEELNK
jgi:FMN phosphatase YigB (HAD superfamily)